MSNPNLNFTHSKCRLRPIHKVQFGIFAPETIVSTYSVLFLPMEHFDLASKVFFSFSSILILLRTITFLFVQKKGSVTKKIKLNNGEEIIAGVTKLERYRNGFPVYGSLADPRMGTNSFSMRCKTCDCTYAGSGSKMDDCPGHFGHIELCTPVYHCGFMDEVTRILRCVCFHCSRLLLDDNVPKDREVLRVHDPETRFRRIHDRCNRTNIKCEMVDTDTVKTFLDDIDMQGINQQAGPTSAVADLLKAQVQAQGVDGSKGDIDGQIVLDGDVIMQPSQFQKGGASLAPKRIACGATMPKFRKEGMVIHITYPDDMELIPGNGQKRQELSAKKVFEIFKNISDDDVRKLGFDPQWARPEWMLVSVLPVPPPHVRPTVMQGDIQAEDDLTFQLSNIVKANLILENSIVKGDPRHIIADFEKLLQARITSFFDNERDDNPRETQKNGRPLKTLRQRLRGKEGRLRCNLMGKRVDFTARTVITADPNLSIDQVGVPRSVALTLTVPITVTPFNIEELRKLVANGPTNWPGALYIIRADHSRIDLRYVRSENDIGLEYGWVVERHLRDDDIVLFNRQPSLHKMSIMGHRAKVLDWSTFRLNLSVTTPYNADFDGDEMNLHVPQSITARADAQELMMVPRNIVTPQSNRNVMGIVQDALLGVTRMTKRDVFITREVFMNAMMWIATWDGIMPAPAIIKPKPLWTGKQLFSMVAPKINYRGKSKIHVDNRKITDPFNYLDSEVLIHGGRLLQGIVDKNIVGTSGGSVVHITWLMKGWEDTRDFMNQIQTAVNYLDGQHVIHGWCRGHRRRCRHHQQHPEHAEPSQREGEGNHLNGSGRQAQDDAWKAADGVVRDAHQRGAERRTLDSGQVRTDLAEGAQRHQGNRELGLERFRPKYLADSGLRGATERAGQAREVWLPAAYTATLCEGRLGHGVAWLRGEQLSTWAQCAGILFPRDERQRGYH